MTAWFDSPGDAGRRLQQAGYLADEATTTTTYLAGELEKPLLVEGPAGVGKTELAKAVARATGADLVRLQCYEGLDEARALYEWNYKKQLLRIQAAGHDAAWQETHDDIFTEEFLLTRPILTAIRRVEPTGLLVDEVDKTDIEVEILVDGGVDRLEVAGDRVPVSFRGIRKVLRIRCRMQACTVAYSQPVVIDSGVPSARHRRPGTRPRPHGS